MGIKFWLVLLLTAIAMVVECTMCDAETNLASHLFIGDHIGKEEEIMMESDISRRLLAQKTRYFSYAALKANATPCQKKGRSYFNCRGHERANPYRRACTHITHCQRFTD
ncbi:hypothetical protein K2173_016673 [Erythroxylum novogranatense]|uniref:Protein RALF-like 19 n=1 Tax=Erythroxylum novogranatense TaxID=1862640 RepID=A0AAV8SS49_9ROSI|nr:hypothetical protein K2173_016673 [Erythroxylum novogranatense]